MNIYNNVRIFFKKFAEKNNYEFINDYWKENDDAYTLCKDIGDFYLEIDITPTEGGLNFHIWYEYCRLNKKECRNGMMIGPTTLLDEAHPVDDYYQFFQFNNNPVIVYKLLSSQIKLLEHTLNHFIDFDSKLTTVEDVNWWLEDFDFTSIKPKKRIMKKLLEQKAGVTDIRVVDDDTVEFTSKWAGKDFTWKRKKEDE